MFVRIDLEDVIDPRRSPVCFTSRDNWEYLDSAWLARTEASAFARTDSLSPPSVAALRALEWVS